MNPFIPCTYFKGINICSFVDGGAGNGYGGGEGGWVPVPALTPEVVCEFGGAKLGLCLQK